VEKIDASGAGVEPFQALGSNGEKDGSDTKLYPVVVQSEAVEDGPGLQNNRPSILVNSTNHRKQFW
jgi:hypothetical protein